MHGVWPIYAALNLGQAQKIFKNISLSQNKAIIVFKKCHHVNYYTATCGTNMEVHAVSLLKSKPPITTILEVHL